MITTETTQIRLGYKTLCFLQDIQRELVVSFIRHSFQEVTDYVKIHSPCRFSTLQVVTEQWESALLWLVGTTMRNMGPQHCDTSVSEYLG